MGILAAGIAPLYSTMVRGEKEQELIFRLSSFRRGIKSYHAKYKKHPATLEEMVEEKMLRQVYRDPMTGKSDWKLIIGKDLGIIDVKSTSTKTALKTEKDDEKNTYDKW